MNFSEALAAIKSGMEVARHGWNGKGMWTSLQTPTEQSKMTMPYIYMRTSHGDLVPWMPSQADLLAEDWFVLLGADSR